MVSESSDERFRPIFILGVPRSGTTLLRAVLGAHPAIAGIPETPWLLGSYGGIVSLRQLVEAVADDRLGLVKNVRGSEEQDVFNAARAFLAHLFAPYLDRVGKRLVVLKTPGDLNYLEFLVKLYPDARYIHICRDGRDVALSYLKRSGNFFARHTSRGHMNFFTLLRRWYDWESKVRSVIATHKLNAISLRYEALVNDPPNQFRAVCDFLDVPFDPKMLQYANAELDLPTWEAGSTDVREAKTINAGSIDRWRSSPMTPAMAYALTYYDNWLVELGYPPSQLKLRRGTNLQALIFPWLAPAASYRDRILKVLERARARVKSATSR